MFPDNVRAAVRQSLDDYAASLNGKGVRDILNSDYKAPEIDPGTGLNVRDPAVKTAVNFWKNARDEWRSKYGSIEGFDNFNEYWMTTAGYSHSMVSVRKALYSSSYQSQRDLFGYSTAAERSHIGFDRNGAYYN